MARGAIRNFLGNRVGEILFGVALGLVLSTGTPSAMAQEMGMDAGMAGDGMMSAKPGQTAGKKTPSLKDAAKKESTTTLASSKMPANDTNWRERLQELRKDRKEVRSPKRDDATSEYPWATPDDVTYLDEMLKEEWEALEFPVAKKCTDNEFVRRATLDIIGRVPTYEETSAFLKHRNRERLVNELLASEEFGKHWANYWSQRLIPNRGGEFEAGPNQRVNRKALNAWLAKEFNRNRPWNEMVQEMVSARGQWEEVPSTNFVIGNLDGKSSSELTSYLTKLFLCVQIQCTECHAHPWNEWKQHHFHGMNAFFIGTREQRATKTNDNGIVGTDYYTLEEIPYQDLEEKGTFYEMRNGLTLYVLPKFLDDRDVNDLLAGKPARNPEDDEDEASSDDLSFGTDLEMLLNEEKAAPSDEPLYLREILATAMTADDNPYFARAAVNRVWFQMFGHSFIKNVDDFDNGQDEPSMPDLLDRLSEDFVNNGFDFKRLVRWVCTSQAYQLSTQQPNGKYVDEAVGFFTYQLPKPLDPNQLFDSLMTVTKYEQTGKSEDTSEIRRRFTQQIYRTFANDSEVVTVPKYEGTITQALLMMNSQLVNEMTSAKPGSFLHELVNNKNMKLEDKVDAIFLSALSRTANGQEKAAIGRHAQTVKTEEELLQDVMWSTLNSSEFIVNH